MFSCSNKYSENKIPEELAQKIKSTYTKVEKALEQYHSRKRNCFLYIYIYIYINIEKGQEIQDALSLPLPEAYKILLRDLRFDYMSMKDPKTSTYTNNSHHYASTATSLSTPPMSKMIRLAQELADLSNALPYEHTNGIFVRVDKERVDLMKGLVMGASETPYAHGAFEYDIFCDNDYPKNPCKMNLTTTGGGAVRFNPNLYNCGKVCLSLLGTWRGSATENWDPKISTILQVLMSTQAIIMSEEVYFNEPGFEGEQGTPEGERKNEGYSNIVRYCNIKYAMIGQIKNPSKGFESVIQRHFYLKKEEIMEEVKEWIKLAENNEASYTAIVNDHNYNWCKTFKEKKTKYKEMLVEAVKELEEALFSIKPPTGQDITEMKSAKKESKVVVDVKSGAALLSQVDVKDDLEEEKVGIGQKTLDIDAEEVKDRWSRYIGALGIEAVRKQAAAHVFLSGVGGLGVEIAKNIVLAGCKSITIHDTQNTSMLDLAAQFFLKQSEIGQNRATVCGGRLQQLNYYVKVNIMTEELPTEFADLDKLGFDQYAVIVLTETPLKTQLFMSQYCRKHKIKFITTDINGILCRIFNDFGEKFDVVDKDGEELADYMIKNISNEEQGVVQLLPGIRHNLSTGDQVIIQEVQGMQKLEQPIPDIKEGESPPININNTIHKVDVIDPFTFKIEDTLKYGPYTRNGMAKQLKTPKTIQFMDFDKASFSGELAIDDNMSIMDFEKMNLLTICHCIYEALHKFLEDNKRKVGIWDLEDAKQVLSITKDLASTRYKLEEFSDSEIKFIMLAAFTSQGVLNPLAGFIGGFVSQEIIKAITQKYTPINQFMYYSVPELCPVKSLTKEILENSEEFTKFKENIGVLPINDRYDGLRVCLGAEVIKKIKHTNLFMVGAGAIGCELLKNYAMLGVGTGGETPQTPRGSIVLTDPDVIEVSNLNRQFLFREKHLRKPKSIVSAAAAVNMNPDLNEHIYARLDKVHEGTSNIFTDSFFSNLSVVTNALDNIQARRYIDQRCVTAQTPLIESGTLGSKGHVQVVIPLKTESYSSQNDPEDNTQIPHCTLKMFPEEALHCVEWARDKFGVMFSQTPKILLNVLEQGADYAPVSSTEIRNLKESTKLLKGRPKTFTDCIHFARYKFEKYFCNDLKQLLYVYPIDSTTKDGSLFWSLPKRPPTPIVFDAEDPLHASFIAAMACLRATIFNIQGIPDKSRELGTKLGMSKQAGELKIAEFIPSDKKAKSISKQVVEAEKEEEKEEEKTLEETEEEKVDPNDIEQQMKEWKSVVQSIDKSSTNIVKAEEFEKDNDQNFHIDLIHSMTNLRANNYKLSNMDWVSVKLKAGRIIPALATTTACVASLQTLELLKVLKGVDLEEQRNCFLNLALPACTLSEPGAPKVIDLGGVKVTLWDRWVINNAKGMSLEGVLDYIRGEYALEPRDVLIGTKPIYFHAVMTLPGKEEQRKKALETNIVEILDVDVSIYTYIYIYIYIIYIG